MPKTTLPLFTETLGQSLTAVEQYVTESGYTFKDREAWDEFWCYCGGVSYGAHKTHSAELETGKPRTRRFISMTVTRMESGRYELVAYIN